MKYCEICGAEMEEDARFCTKCGAVCGEKEIEVKNFEQKSPKGKKIVIIIISIVLLIVVLAAMLFFVFRKTINSKTIVAKENKKKSVSTVKEAKEVKESEGLSTKIEKYIGYWGIDGDTTKELTIQVFTKDKVVFSLWSDSKDSIEDITAKIKDDKASFSVSEDGEKLKGTLTFQKETIKVQITKSEVSGFPVGILEFNEKHKQSIQYIDKSTTNSESAGNTVKNAENSNYYILPQSSSRLLDYSDIAYLSKSELSLARNEIYARHGRIFTNPQIRSYFESQPWYYGTISPNDFPDSLLSDIEKKNVEFIKQFE